MHTDTITFAAVLLAALLIGLAILSCPVWSYDSNRYNMDTIQECYYVVPSASLINTIPEPIEPVQLAQAAQPDLVQKEYTVNPIRLDLNQKPPTTVSINGVNYRISGTIGTQFFGGPYIYIAEPYEKRQVITYTIISLCLIFGGIGTIQDAHSIGTGVFGMASLVTGTTGLVYTIWTW